MSTPIRKNLPIAAPEFRIVRNKVGRKKRNSLAVREIATATFDPSANTAQRATGTHNLGVFLPDKAIITRAYYQVKTTFTSANDSATIALQANTANDLKAAVAISNGANPWDAGIHDGVPVGTAATMVALTAERELKVVVGVQALTAGRANLFVEYVIAD
jgi:hypothetical protein